MDNYKHAHLHLLDRSPNCTAGYIWVWRPLGQCLEDVEQLVGFIMGVTAIITWSAGHVSLYRYQRRRARSSSNRNIRCFVAMHWFADCLGCIGAILANQLSTQVLFGLFTILLHTICCFHSYSGTRSKRNQKPIKEKSLKRRKSNIRRFMFPMFFMCPMAVLSLIMFSSSTNVVQRSLEDQDLKDMIPLMWVFGYIFGAMAGVLHCCVKIIDILDAYITVECSKTTISAYIASGLGELLYVSSVFTQGQTLGFLYHTLPWTLPRLIAAGLDIGILVQRIRQKKKGKRRLLSNEDTECLISSDSDMDGYYGSGDEEVIWMPLRSVNSAIPTHPVCASRIQILSESERMSYTIDWCESRRTSTEAFDVSEPQRIPTETADGTDPQRTSSELLEVAEAHLDVIDKDHTRDTSQHTDIESVSMEESKQQNTSVKHAAVNNIKEDSINSDTPNIIITPLQSVSHDQQTATWIQINTNTKSERDYSDSEY